MCTPWWKLHKWSRWTERLFRSKYASLGSGDTLGQTRHCERCGFVQLRGL